MPFALGFLPLLTAATPLITGLMGGGGGAAPAAPAGPIDNKANFGPVNFGAKYLGDSAVKQAPAVIAAENQSWTKFLPWIVGGVVSLFALVLILPRLGRK